MGTADLMMPFGDWFQFHIEITFHLKRLRAVLLPAERSMAFSRPNGIDILSQEARGSLPPKLTQILKEVALS